MRIRIRFTKLGKIRWTSHRDMARMWERGLRRAEIAVAYSEGFSPRPRISFGLALPTGAESLAEYLDIEIRDKSDPYHPAVDLDSLGDRLSPVLPEGIDVTGSLDLAAGGPSLQHDVVACRWEMTLPAKADHEQAVARLVGAASMVVARQRKGQDVTDDIRPAIVSLTYRSAPEATSVVEAELATLSRGLRPSELLGVLGMDAAEARMVRTHQWIVRDGARREPIPAGATAAPPAQWQAS